MPELNTTPILSSIDLTNHENLLSVQVVDNRPVLVCIKRSDLGFLGRLWTWLGFGSASLKNVSKFLSSAEGQRQLDSVTTDREKALLFANLQKLNKKIFEHTQRCGFIRSYTAEAVALDISRFNTTTTSVQIPEIVTRNISETNNNDNREMPVAVPVAVTAPSIPASSENSSPKPKEPSSLTNETLNPVSMGFPEVNVTKVHKNSSGDDLSLNRRTALEYLERAKQSALTIKDPAEKANTLKEIFDVALNFDLDLSRNIADKIEDLKMRSKVLLRYAQKDRGYDKEHVYELVRKACKSMYEPTRVICSNLTSYLKECFEIITKFNVLTAQGFATSLKKDFHIENELEFDHPLEVLVQVLVNVNLDFAKSRAAEIATPTNRDKAFKLICIAESKRNVKLALQMVREKLPEYLFGDALEAIVKIEVEKGHLTSAKEIAQSIPDKQGTSKLGAFLAIIEKEFGLDPSSAQQTAQIIQNAKVTESEHPWQFQNLKNKIQIQVIKEKAKRDIESARELARSIKDIDDKVDALIEIAKIDPTHDFKEVKELVFSSEKTYNTDSGFTKIAIVEYFYSKKDADNTITFIQSDTVKADTYMKIGRQDATFDFTRIFDLPINSKSTQIVAISALERGQIDFKWVKKSANLARMKSVLLELVKFNLPKDIAIACQIAEAILHERTKDLAYLEIGKYQAKENIETAEETFKKISSPEIHAIAYLEIAKLLTPPPLSSSKASKGESYPFKINHTMSTHQTVVLAQNSKVDIKDSAAKRIRALRKKNSIQEANQMLRTEAELGLSAWKDESVKIDRMIVKEAILLNQQEIAKKLIESGGVDLTQRTAEERMKSWKGSHEAQDHIKVGPGATDDHLPLIEACRLGQTEIVKLLLSHGDFDLNIDNNTCLWNAFGIDNDDILAMFLDRDALAVSLAENMIDMAKSRKRPKIEKFLTDALPGLKMKEEKSKKT